MRYVSTRGTAPVLDFEEAMLAGLARDGGLYLPETWPSLSTARIRAMRGKSYEEVALEVIAPFVGEGVSHETLRGHIDAAYRGFGHPARAPLTQLGPNDWLLELWRGPTLAFKDFAMQLIGRLFEAALERRDRRATIVGATSGDTGSAAIEAFRGLARADVAILYPHGRVSEVQRRQMTTPDDPNVHALAVEGDFDACQALVKAMFNDHAFRDRMGLAAVNSINWVRILAQVVYYFTAAVSLGAPERPVAFTVPTGNFGDIFAGYVARRMGLPIAKLVVASNENDILHRTLQSGRHDRAGVVPTSSPSMDIEVSSNFERLLFEIYDRDAAALRQLMAELGQGGFALSQGALSRLREDFDSGRADQRQVARTIRDLRERTGMVIDTHTAVGVAAAAQARGDAAVPMVVLSTAHPAKFPDAVEAACGVRPPLPPHMADLYDRPERISVVANDLAAVQDEIARRSRA